MWTRDAEKVQQVKSQREQTQVSELFIDNYAVKHKHHWFGNVAKSAELQHKHEAVKMKNWAHESRNKQEASEQKLEVFGVLPVSSGHREPPPASTLYVAAFDPPSTYQAIKHVCLLFSSEVKSN